MSSDTQRYAALIRSTLVKDYRSMFREARDNLSFPFLVPGSAGYSNQLWDWDSFFSNVALRQILLEQGDAQASAEAVKYEQGCVLNFLDYTDVMGWTPFVIAPQWDRTKVKPANPYDTNIHLPVLAQHAAFLTRLNGGDAAWLRPRFEKLQLFHNFYRNNFFHRVTGLYFWADAMGVAVDNDPTIYYRPKKSVLPIFLNAMMVKELEAAAYLADAVDLGTVAGEYRRLGAALITAIREHCYDPWTKFYYSCDKNLLPAEPVLAPDGTTLSMGRFRDWDCVLVRIQIWSGFLALWSGVATPEQARHIVELHYRNPETFNAPYGVRSLSPFEKMYNVRATSNPSNWLGPIWGISNYLVFRGLIKYGYLDDARDLAVKTVHLFGRDIEKTGALHEYYQPENGEPLMNHGFQNWNYLVLNMIAWLEGREAVSEL